MMASISLSRSTQGVLKLGWQHLSGAEGDGLQAEAKVLGKVRTKPMAKEEAYGEVVVVSEVGQLDDKGGDDGGFVGV